MQKNLCLLFLVFGVVCLFTSRSEATPYKIKDLIGPLHIVPTEVEGMDTPEGVEVFENQMVVYGMHELKPAIQRILFPNPGSPQVHPFQIYDSLESYAYPLDGDKRGTIRDVELIAGELVSFGESSSHNAVHFANNYPSEGTIWNQLGQPVGIGFAGLENHYYSDILQSASNGTYVGYAGSGMSAIVGSYLLDEVNLLPVTYLHSGFATNITSDAKYITGMDGSYAAAWVHDENGGLLDYLKLNLNLEAPPDGMGGGLDIRGADVLYDPYLGNVFLGEYTNLNTWDWQLAAWQLDTGTLIKVFPESSTLADTVLIDDTWVIGFNTWNDAGLGTLHDPGLLYLSELPEFQAIRNPSLVALYAGSLGIFASDPSGMVDFHLASYNPVGYVPPPDDLPEPSSFILLAVGCAVLAFWHKKVLRRSNDMLV